MGKESFPSHKMVFADAGKRNFRIFYKESKVGNMWSGNTI
jgi:hypothetical protein